MFAAWFVGLGPGILATILSLISAIYFVIPPVFQLRVATREEAAGGIVFLGVSTFISILNEALRRSRARSEQRLQELTIETSRRSRAEQEVAESKRQAERARDLFQTTLASIGDAVIATDAEGRVTFLNTVAQQLTGWSRADALGEPISEVFVIRNERTGAAVESPVDKVFRGGVVVGLANHTILITKDGRDTPIEDSAAPIRDENRQVLGAVLVFRDVTERRRSEEAMARSEERLKLALDAGQIGVWDWDIGANRIEWSDRIYEIHGVERGVFRGDVEAIAQLIHPEDRERVREATEAALRRGALYDLDYRIVRPSGELVWVSSTARVFQNENGQPARMLGAINDVTARKHAEADMRQQWLAFDTALSNTPDFNYLFTLDGRFSYVNRARLRMLQKTYEEVVGKNFWDLNYPPELAERFLRQIQQVIETKESIRDQAPFTGPNGVTRQYEYIFVPVLSGEGQVTAVAGTTHDITDQKTIEDALRKSEERLTLALEAGGGVGTWDYDIPSDRLHCNARFAQLFSVDPERAAAGAPISEFTNSIHQEDRAQVAEKLQRAIQTGGEYAAEYRVVPQTGRVHWLSGRGRAHLDDAGKPTRFLGVVIDITERKQAEEELTRSNERLTRANRELEEFAYVASHDLQEPLRMVNIYTQIILQDLGGDPAKLGQYAGFVQQGVTRMEALIHDLLTFSRAVHTEELPIGTADLAESFREALSVLRNRIEDSGCVITAEFLPQVSGDVSQMAHVFQNLLSNALKYRKQETPPRIHIAARRNGSDWIISVRDNGIGFQPQYAERIFGLFKRLHKDEYPGTGLGLAICKRIVERYGGRIWAEGTPGVGATFHFSLPDEEGQKGRG
jgi:PAS domain S-box-containing protein